MSNGSVIADIEKLTMLLTSLCTLIIRSVAQILTTLKISIARDKYNT